MKLRYQEIYRTTQLPIFQNRVFHSENEAKNFTKGDIVLVQNLETEVILYE